MGPIFGGGRPPPPPPVSPTTARTHFVGALTCGPTPYASANGIALSAIDRTGRNIDLCARMDTALSKAPNLANYQGYDLALELSTVDVNGGDVGCKLRFEIVAPAARTGFVMTGAKIQGAPAIVAFSIDDCINASIEDTFVRKIFP